MKNWVLVRLSKFGRGQKTGKKQSQVPLVEQEGKK